MKKTLTLLFVFAIGIIPGYFIGNFYTKNNLPVSFTCQDIANFHADLLLKNNITSFNTDSTNPDKDVNQRASDLNAAILRICKTDPREKTCTPEMLESSDKLCPTSN
jgi:hypothetical protein